MAYVELSWRDKMIIRRDELKGEIEANKRRLNQLQGDIFEVENENAEFQRERDALDIALQGVEPMAGGRLTAEELDTIAALRAGTAVVTLTPAYDPKAPLTPAYNGGDFQSRVDAHLEKLRAERAAAPTPSQA